MTDFMIKLLSIFSLIGGMGVIGVIGYVIKNRFFKKDKYYTGVSRLLRKWGMRGAFFVALGSAIGSLLLSEIANFEACTLCWLQRGLMYPLVIILGIGMIRENRLIRKIAITLGGLGATMAGYQYYLQISLNPFAPCSTVLFAASCSDRYVNEFGFVTIPFMSLVGFLLITLLVYFSSAKVKSNEP